VKFISRVRLGVALGRVQGITLEHVDRALIEVQPAHLVRATGCELGNGRDDRAARADLVRALMR
jgi:protein-arginine kinase